MRSVDLAKRTRLAIVSSVALLLALFARCYSVKAGVGDVVVREGVYWILDKIAEIALQDASERQKQQREALEDLNTVMTALILRAASVEGRGRAPLSAEESDSFTTRFAAAIQAHRRASGHRSAAVAFNGDYLPALKEIFSAATKSIPLRNGNPTLALYSLALSDGYDISKRVAIDLAWMLNPPGSVRKVEPLRATPELNDRLRRDHLDSLSQPSLRDPGGKRILLKDHPLLKQQR